MPSEISLVFEGCYIFFSAINPNIFPMKMNEAFAYPINNLVNQVSAFTQEIQFFAIFIVDFFRCIKLRTLFKIILARREF